jgi:hypothetical protein
MRRCDGKVPELMQAAADQTEPCALVDMSDDVRALAGEIVSDLALRTTDRARRRLMTTELGSNGFEAWGFLAAMVEGGGPKRRTGLLRTILEFDFEASDFCDRVFILGVVRV